MWRETRYQTSVTWQVSTKVRGVEIQSLVLNKERRRQKIVCCRTTDYSPGRSFLLYPCTSPPGGSQKWGEKCPPHTPGWAPMYWYCKSNIHVMHLYRTIHQQIALTYESKMLCTQLLLQLYMKLQTTAMKACTVVRVRPPLCQNGPVVILNYSQLQKYWKYKSWIHCKMQGALSGKTMHVVCASLNLSSFHSNRLHSCTTTIEILWKKIQWNTCHQMASLAFKFYQIQFPPGGAYDAPPDAQVGCEGDSPSPFSTPRRLQRLAHRASTTFQNLPPPLDWLTAWLRCGFASHSTQNRSFRRRFPKTFL